MGPKEQIEAAFGANQTLYDILGVAKDASAAAIRKAYFKTALICVSCLLYLPACLSLCVCVCVCVYACP